MQSGVPAIDWWLVAGISFLFAVLTRTRLYLHREVAFVPGKLIGRNKLALWLYALLMIPGTFLHELSHTIVALALAVDIRRFSIGPRDGALGSVEMEKADFFRRTIIGVAPLIVGTVAILGIAALAFDLSRIYDTLIAGQLDETVQTLAASFSDFRGWLAAYLIFVVSANMFPSPTDLSPLMRLLLLPLPLLVAGAVHLSAPLLPWLVEGTNTVFRWLLLIFAFTLAIDLPILLLLMAGSEAVAKQFPPR